MSKSLTYILIATLCLSTLVLSVSAHHTDSDSDDEQRCTRRPDIEECYDLPSTPTCAYYTENCPFKVCGRDQANWCYACNDSSTVYYRNGTCKESEVVNECYEGDTSCDPANDPQAQKVYEPVCGIPKGGKNRKTFNNTCDSCAAKGYDWYRPGPCKEDKNWCSAKEREKNCTSAKYNPVCAHLKAEDNNTVFTTAWSGCAACADKAVDYYTEGECGPLRDNVTYCLPNTRAEFCTLELNPVCGFYFDENNMLQHKVGGNPSCTCAEEGIVYHIPGPCIFTCDRRPNIIFECDGTLVEPICGTYEENGEKVNVSLQNSCVGCYNVPIKIDSYVDGLCPGDEGVYCENYAGGFAQGRISPVCGVTEEDCDNDSCRTSFTEPSIACADNSTLLFKKGLCPGDDGFSCSPWREGGAVEGNNAEGFDYGQVCGYNEDGCDDNSCRDNYTNQTTACADESVIFFTEGTCL